VSFEKCRWVFCDGALVPWEAATVHLSANSFQYGSGVFEGIRCYRGDHGPAVFRMQAHLDRFRESAAQHDLELPFDSATLAGAICSTIDRNGFDECYIRPICYYGSGRPGLVGHGCPVHVAILAWPWDAPFGGAGHNSGVRVTLSKWVRIHPRMLPTTAKASGNYLNSILAARDARQRGYDEALLLDAEGNLSEGPTENLFLVQGGCVVTNDEDSSILLGITRDSVLRIARDLGYPVRIRKFALSDLRCAEEAFFTGTAAEITPIREVDGKLIGTGCRGPVTEIIQKTYCDATLGRAQAYLDWLHPVHGEICGAAVSGDGKWPDILPE
jgi:branched-chain amino acid aminotransferase